MTAAGTFSAQRQQNRFILQQLAKRDRNKRDASSFLGQFWQVLNPFIYMIVMVLIFSDLFGSKDFVHYPIYVLSGTIVYSLFTEGTTGCLTALSSNKNFLIKSSIARNLYPVERVYVALINFGFSAVIYVFFALLSGIRFSVTWLLVIPDIFLFLVMILGIGKVLAIINVEFADITYFYKIFILFVLYGSALFYSTTRMSPTIQFIISLNPVYLAIAILRQAVMDGIVAAPTLWLKLSAIAISCYLLGSQFYERRVQNIVAKL